MSQSCAYCGKELADDAQVCPHCTYPVDGRVRPEPPKPLQERHKPPLSVWFGAIWLSLMAAVSAMGVIFCILDWSGIGSAKTFAKWVATTAFFSLLAISVLRGWRFAYWLLGWGIVIQIGLSLLSGGIDRVVAGLFFLGPVLLCVNTHSAREFFRTRSMKRF